VTRGLDAKTTTGRTGRIELPYLDGVRGLAALAVALYHAFLFTGRTGDSYADLPVLGRIVGFGYLGVPVFIVLSGYVLALPVLSQPDFRLRHGFANYIGRRARRILPPYYAALIITLILIAAIPLMRHESGTQWDSKVPVTGGGVVSHFLLLHDLKPGWIGQINGPLWSIAVEWQIYFLMPLILLPLWRRLPPALVAGAAVLVTVLPSAVGVHRLDYAHPWLVGLFACGMLAAQATMRVDWSLRWLRPATAIAGVLLVATLLVAWHQAHDNPWAAETATGIVVAAMLVLAGRPALDGRPGRVRGFLQTRPVTLLGLASYSIYLLHSPLLGLSNLLTLTWGLPTWGQYLFLTFVCLPVDLAICAGFYWLVERRFKNTHQRHAIGSQQRHAQEQRAR
jgi:peptidoglycan/LPS O-acetylase OafA/YrhL